MSEHEPEIDFSELAQKLSSMLQNGNASEELKHAMEHFSTSTPPPEASSFSSFEEDASFPNIDLDMLLKMKKMMDAMKSTKNDPRANLLLSLKPYLRASRREKLDQYIQLTKVWSLLNEMKKEQ